MRDWLSRVFGRGAGKRAAMAGAPLGDPDAARERVEAILAADRDRPDWQHGAEDRSARVRANARAVRERPDTKRARRVKARRRRKQRARSRVR